MDKEQVAAIFEEIAHLLKVRGENAFRCQAYHNAARALRHLETPLQDAIASNRLTAIPGIGKTLEEKITTLATTGHLSFYEDLRKQTPPGLIPMLRLPGLGPKKIKVLWNELGIDSLESLQQACLDGRLAALKGFGPKTQEKLLQGLQFIESTGHRVRIDQAERLAAALVDELKQCPGIVRFSICGSLRRRKETVNDLDLLISSPDPVPIIDCFTKLRGVAEVLSKGTSKSSIILDMSRYGGKSLRLQADLRVVSDEQFPFALHYFTGSKEHNITMRARAQERELKLSEYGLGGSNGDVACATEERLFHALGLDFVPPEMREGTGEIEAAEQHDLPKLIEANDIRGVFHCHTDWSDGRASLEEMARAAKQLGYEYLGIADHSQSLTIARGLSPDRVSRQEQAIDALNAAHPEIRLLKGTECDILPDGSLDFSDQVLASFDYVVASVHSHFKQSEEEMTRRIVRAVAHPLVTMLGHATGRLLLRRDGYKVDLEAVLQAAARHGTLIEINAQPTRLDLDWLWCKRARSLGVRLVINPDAHSVEELQLMRYGVDVARRGWLRSADVYNCQTLAVVINDLAVRKERAAGKTY